MPPSTFDPLVIVILHYRRIIRSTLWLNLVIITVYSTTDWTFIIIETAIKCKSKLSCSELNCNQNLFLFITFQLVISRYDIIGWLCTAVSSFVKVKSTTNCNHSSFLVVWLKITNFIMLWIFRCGGSMDPDKSTRHCSEINLNIRASCRRTQSRALEIRVKQ